ncbi:MAG: fibronectin type III domain-containing protein, partial [Cyclobacteriaceae bacterium]
MKTFTIYLKFSAILLLSLLTGYQAMSQKSLQNGTTKLNIRAPEFLDGSYSSTPDRISLSWFDFNSFSVDGYIIEREGRFGGFSEIARTSNTFYDDFSISAGRSYTYRVKAYVGSDESLPSPTVTVSTTIPLAPPSGLTATLNIN